MNNNRLTQFLQNPKKWKIFAAILFLIAVAGTLLSFLTRETLLRDNEQTRPRLAVVAALQTPAGAALQRGAELLVEQVNREGGIKGRPLELMSVEETPDAADFVVADKRVIGVVGHLDHSTLPRAATVYSRAQIPLVTPRHLPAAIPGVIAMGLDPKDEARFVANYARNIQQQRLMYVVRENGSEFDPLVEPFIDVYQRFETPVRQVWSITPGADEAAQVDALLAELRNIDVGAVYIATRPELAARLVKGIRNTGNALELFGPSQLSSAVFLQSLKLQSGKDAALQSHGIIAATPVLFDTANEQAQRFQTRFQQKFGITPDWLASFAYDAARIASSGGATGATIKGVTGELSVVDGLAQLPLQIGLYNGDKLISAPVQLLPITKGAGFNYIDALREGRVLYVNDRFMFKTNVVYVGTALHDISNVDRQKETATLDLSIWFRYRGKFDPKQMQILNALGPVDFGKPEESKDSDDVQYRRYRIKQAFRLNFTDDKRAYNHHVAGIVFRHQQLNRNNLMYVVDVLGMPTGNALLDDLRQRHSVKSGSGWTVENAWVAQDVVRERGDGAPQYVGMTGELPLFSTITAGVLLKPEALAARDVIAPEYFIYIAIFGLLGSLVAVGLDTRKLGRYWAVQSWVLRAIFWPMLLLAIGNLAIDRSFNHWTPGTTNLLVTIYESAWWLLGARLTDMAIRRFIWAPLEARAGRKIPNVMKVLVTILIFALAVAGIIAVVMNQTLTSLLATSGVLAMIIGLAIQANIANIFSGIILNIERPFKIGDYIKINNVVGQVKDITWRTIRVESGDGPMVSLANSKVSEALMENFSIVPHGIAAETLFYTPPETDPALVLEILNEAIAKSKSIIKDDPVAEPGVRYKGVINVNGQWVGCFAAGYRVKIVPKKSAAREELWNHAYHAFTRRGIPLIPASNSPTALVEEKAY